MQIPVYQSLPLGEGGFCEGNSLPSQKTDEGFTFTNIVKNLLFFGFLFPLIRPFGAPSPRGRLFPIN